MLHCHEDQSARSTVTRLTVPQRLINEFSKTEHQWWPNLAYGAMCKLYGTLINSDASVSGPMREIWLSKDLASYLTTTAQVLTLAQYTEGQKSWKRQLSLKYVSALNGGKMDENMTNFVNRLVAIEAVDSPGVGFCFAFRALLMATSAPPSEVDKQKAVHLFKMNAFRDTSRATSDSDKNKIKTENPMSFLYRLQELARLSSARDLSIDTASLYPQWLGL